MIACNRCKSEDLILKIGDRHVWFVCKKCGYRKRSTKAERWIFEHERTVKKNDANK